MRKSLGFLILAVFVIVASLGTVGEARDLASSQVLHIGFDANDLKSLDPFYASSNVDRSIVDMVFSGLVRFRPGDIRTDYIEPDLAESWEVSKDGLSWTFRLCKGVTFHPWDGNPGYELTSEDIVFSLERAADPKRSAYASQYTDMSFKAIDKYTVRITMAKPLSKPLFLTKVMNYTGGFIVPKRVLEKMGDKWFATHPVGTGPFMFREYKPMAKVVLARNEKYFRSPPILRQVEVFYVPDLSARNLGIRKGDLDLVEGPMEQSWVEEMRALPNIKADIFGPGATHVLHLNMKKKPLDDIRVRQAIAYAISREELVLAAGREVAAPIYSIIPAPYLPGGLTKDEVQSKKLLYSVDRAKAMKLLADAGYPKGIPLEVIHTEIASMLQPIENIQAQLRKVGIDLNLKVVDHAAFHSLIRKDLSPIVHYSAWRPNADIFLSTFYHSSARVVEGAKPDTNFSHYDKIDRLIEEARNTVDSEKQAELWKEAQFQILADCAAIPLFLKQFTFARRDNVDYGYELKSNFNLFPPIRETTKIFAR